MRSSTLLPLTTTRSRPTPRRGRHIAPRSLPGTRRPATASANLVELRAEQVPAVDDELGAVDVGREIRREEDDRAGDLVRVGPTAHRDAQRSRRPLRLDVDAFRSALLDVLDRA